MHRAALQTTLLVLLAACQSTRSSTHAAGWSYAGDTGPAHWAELAPEYALARTGKRQSPIDILPSRAAAQDGPAFSVAYGPTTLEILNNGHTIEDDYHGGGKLMVDGHTWSLAQFHFHSPSEHTIEGRHSPMELHLVHKDAAGKLAVLGVLIEEGADNAELARLWKHLPATPGRTEHVEGESVDASKLLPASLASYRYSGSLTTPPCSEEVAWFVLQQPIQASRAQIDAFRKIVHGNNRPTQPLNGRVVAACR
ncbi:MAG: carbonic anhydrase family protein [Planctomycetes bacterium]|nr:carbonic anhydrase family protein [Planctomycetota bacterium]